MGLWAAPALGAESVEVSRSVRNSRFSLRSRANSSRFALGGGPSSMLSGAASTCDRCQLAGYPSCACRCQNDSRRVEGYRHDRQRVHRHEKGSQVAPSLRSPKPGNVWDCSCFVPRTKAPFTIVDFALWIQTTSQSPLTLEGAMGSVRNLLGALGAA